MGIAPNIWGPSAWAFIHLIVLSEPEPLDTTRLPHYKQFFTTLTHLLPCAKCRTHLQENLTKLPDLTTLTTKRALFDWTTQLHNEVNKITHKPIWDPETSFQHWKDIAEGKKQLSLSAAPSTPNYWMIATFVAIVVIVGLLLSRCWSMQLRKM